MVSLRERKSRPSYAIIHEGLDDLSSNEGSDSGDENEDGQTAGPSWKATKSKKKIKDDDESGHDVETASLSSGDSSEFQPDNDNGGKKGGKAGSVGTDEDEDEDDDLEEIDELESETLSSKPQDEDEDMDDGSIIDVASPPPTTGAVYLPRGGPGARGNPKKQPSRSSYSTVHSSSNNNRSSIANTLSKQIPSTINSGIYNASSISSIPPAYRQLIKESSILIANIPPPKPPPADASKYRGVGWELFPLGTNLPWGTRFSRSGGVIVLKELEGVERRKTRMKEMWRYMAHWVPREAWEGEAWWGEMYTGGGPRSLGPGDGDVEMDVDGNDPQAGSEEAGPSLPKGWRWKDEVTMGLERVGRFTAQQVDLISASEAAPYLPSRKGKEKNTDFICHIGPHDRQERVRFNLFDHRRIEQSNPVKRGFMMYAGGPVWGLDWTPYPAKLSHHDSSKQYLAISTLPNLDTEPMMSQKYPRETPASIQIWSVINTDDEPKAQCEMVLCIQGGAGMALKWMPLGACDDSGEFKTGEALPKLGILAVAQLDGSLGVYAVPHPRSLKAQGGAGNEPIYLRMHEPLLRLEVADANVTCLDWLTGSKLVAGLSNGHLIIWNVLEALLDVQKGKVEPPLPVAYVTLASASIRSIKVGRTPRADVYGQLLYDEDPAYIVYGSYDGASGLVDTRDMYHPIELSRHRLPCMAVGWSSQMASPLHVDVDYQVTIRKIRGVVGGRSFGMGLHRGPAWDLSSSEYHTMVASAASDGSVLLTSVSNGFGRPRGAPMLYSRMYEMDYDTQSGEYRMIDDYLPETMPSDASSARQATIKKLGLENDSSIAKSAAWPVEVGVHCVEWLNSGGLSHAGMLASGMACGLVRVDVVEGNWKTGTPLGQFSLP